MKRLEASRPWLLPICCKPGQRTTHDGTVAISHRKETHGMLTSAMTVGLHGICHTKPQELCARHCVTKQCLGLYLSFVTDVHLSFVTDLPMHLDRIANSTFYLLVPSLATEPNKGGSLWPKTVLLHFSVQKVSCGLEIVRGSPEMHQSNKNAISCCGEILPNARSNKRRQQLQWGNFSQNAPE